MSINRLIHMNIVSDYSAVGHYRLIFPEMCARTTTNNYAFIESSHYIGDPHVYSTVRTCKIQRPCTIQQYAFIENFLKPLSERYGFWLIMDIDDCLIYKDIPKYNIAREAFNDEVGKLLGKAMSLVDFVTTTTDYIKNYYMNHFNLPSEKFIVIPNYLPRWWIGNSFNANETMYYFDKNVKSKLKVAFVCGGNHFDLNNQNDGKDDFTHLIEWVKNSVNDYEFHFVGGVPQQLIGELNDGKIIHDSTVDVMNYPTEIYNRHYNLWVCPLEDNVFNRCKSNIKLIEAWSMGIPVMVQKCECYNRYTPDVFDTADDLDNMITTMVNNKKLMIDKIITGRRIIDSGDNNSINGWWLEKNMDKHKKIFSLPQRTMKINMADVSMEEM